MSEPIVFISRSRVKDGKLDELRAFLREGAPQLEAGKPRTLAFLAYLGADGRDVSIIHVFPDAAAFDAHVEGAEGRSQAAYQLMSPVSFEIYGRPGDATLGDFKGAAASELQLDVHPELAAGFVREP